MLTTFSDLVLHCLDHVGGATDEVNLRHARRAVLAGYSEVANSRAWLYYQKAGNITTVPSYATGTVSYDEATREVTLTGGTWPSWAALGSLQIAGVIYAVTERVSNSIIILATHNNPGADLTDVSYTLFQDIYSLPADFMSMDELSSPVRSSWPSYVHPAQLLAERTVGPGQPRIYTIRADERFHGRMAVHVYPPPSTAIRWDFLYKRRPRPLAIDSYTTGAATCTSASATVTGTATVWTANMVGAVIRFGANATNAPTGPAGEFPATLERIVTAVNSATELEIDAVPGENLAGVAYTISDPVDVEEGSMLTYLLRECERQLRILKRDPNPGADEAWLMSRVQAWEADSRTTHRRSASGAAHTGTKLADFPPHVGA